MIQVQLFRQHNRDGTSQDWVVPVNLEDSKLPVYFGRTGSTLRLTGFGAVGMRGAPAGDLYVQIRVQPHPRFRREGDDLVVGPRAEHRVLGLSLGPELLDGGRAEVASGRVMRENDQGHVRPGHLGFGFVDRDLCLQAVCREVLAEAAHRESGRGVEHDRSGQPVGVTCTELPGRLAAKRVSYEDDRLIEPGGVQGLSEHIGSFGCRRGRAGGVTATDAGRVEPAGEYVAPESVDEVVPDGVRVGASCEQYDRDRAVAFAWH